MHYFTHYCLGWLQSLEIYLITAKCVCYLCSPNIPNAFTGQWGHGFRAKHKLWLYCIITTIPKLSYGRLSILYVLRFYYILFSGCNMEELGVILAYFSAFQSELYIYISHLFNSYQNWKYKRQTYFMGVIKVMLLSEGRFGSQSKFCISALCRQIYITLRVSSLSEWKIIKLCLCLKELYKQSYRLYSWIPYSYRS